MELTNLNDMQEKAVLQTEGPVLVLAGAGSGKTKVLTTRIVHLIKNLSVNPCNILAITFTNKAAKEMRERVEKEIGSMTKLIQISTFHSFGLKIVKENHQLLGYESNFTIIDSDDSLTIIKKIMKELNIDDKFFNPKAIKSSISSAKNELIDEVRYESYAFNEYEKKVLEVYRIYQNKLKVTSTLDFDDLLIMPIKLFKNKEILIKYQDIYKYLLIDEYQDTNLAQYTLANLLASKNKNIFVVGDIDQSIYSFRGANYKNILNFEKDYKGVITILLEENYRSTKKILSVANDVIKNNKSRKDKILWTNNDDGEKVIYYKLESGYEEASYVIDEIKFLEKKGISKNDIAVLYRTNAQSRVIEDTLVNSNIPYRIVGSTNFYKRKEIKDTVAYLKLVYNNKDDVSLLRVINFPKRGIGAKTIENLSIKAIEENKSLYEVIDSGKELEFKNIIEIINSKKDDLSIVELIDLIISVSGMKKSYEEDKSLESEVRLENIREFKSVARYFEETSGLASLEEFLDNISLMIDTEEDKNVDNAVTLMTVHAAKGLEFDYVFIVGLEETIFPHRNSLGSTEEIEEERRLMYVAMTRAKKKLYLTNSRRRTYFGETQCNAPSRFINEINFDDLEVITTEKPSEIKFDKSSVIDSTIEYKIGEKILHDKYGIGVIVSIERSILTVAFAMPHGIQKLIKGHKTFKKI